MKQTIQAQRKINNPPNQPNKYRSISTEESAAHIDELNRIGLIFQLTNPLKKTILIQKNQQNSISQHQPIYGSSSCFFQALNMDLTSYQTLKQLIMENKELVKQSQSAYFLSKQSQKLINLIDGWSQLNKNQYLQENFLIFEQKQQSQKQTKKLRSNLRNQSEAAFEQQEREKTRLKLKEKQMARVEGEGELKRVEASMHEKRVSKKLLSRPALIVDQQRLEQDLSESQQIDQIKIEIQKIPHSNQNNINSSNIITLEQMQAQKTKKIKRENQVNPMQSRNKVIRLYSSKQQQIQNLSEIIRPQYQKTQVSFSSTQSLTDSRDKDKSIEQDSNLINSSQQLLQVNNAIKKKTIPLLKKGQASTLSYHQHLKNKQVNVFINEAKKQINPKAKANKNQHESTIQNVQNNVINQDNLEKGFMSEDTDANSRLTMFTTKHQNNRRDHEGQERRSLSPKVEGRKKVIVKLSSNLNKKQSSKDPKLESKKRSQFQTNQGQANQKIQQVLVSKKHMMKEESIQVVSFTNKNKIQIELKQLQDEFMNRNKKKLQQSNNQSAQEQVSQLRSTVNNWQGNELEQSYQGQNKNQNQEPQPQPYNKPPPKSNKTLQLIKKASNKHTNPTAQQQPDHAQTRSTNTNRVTNPQLNSIVLEEEPWECDQLELEEELKAIDEKIQGRKSFLSAKNNTEIHLYDNNKKTLNTLENQPSSFNSIPYEKFNSTQPLHFQNSQNPQPTSFTHHKRSHTALNIQQTKDLHDQKLYNEHLFQEQELFQQNQHSDHHSNQPKVVRLSLTALANNMNKKSRESLKSHHDRKSMVKNTSQTNLTKNKNSKNPAPYSHQMRNDASFDQMHKDPSVSRMNKEASCKSILLFEEAEKRGISPTKSSRSVKINNKSVSPIKLYVQKDRQQNGAKTPKNIKNTNQIHGQNQFIEVQHQRIQNFGNHSPSPLNRNNQITNKNRPISNFSPLSKENININGYDRQQRQGQKNFSSHSRTLSDMIESEYSRGKKSNKIVRENYQGEKKHNMKKGKYQADEYIMSNNEMESEYSMYSNCQKYFERQQLPEKAYGRQDTEDWESHAGQKWSIPVKNTQAFQPKKPRMVLLSDQLSGY